MIPKRSTINPQPKKPRSKLSQRILIGLVLGVSTGLFLGDYASHLSIVGRAYVGLLQMSILPYMVVSLIGGIGQLNYDKATRLAITGGIVLLGSWLLAFLVVFLMTFAFPESDAGSFFSPSLVASPDVDFIDLYIPVNPFSSLARTVVPAAAVFSVVFGIALIGVKDKAPLVKLFVGLQETLTRVAMMVVQLTPLGVFAIAANAAGTMTIEEFGRLQAYIVTFVAATLLLTFWILPGLVATLTQFSYRDVLRASRVALLTGFVTGNLFVVLPMLIESGKNLFDMRGESDQDTDSYVEVLVPTSFNFPNIWQALDPAVCSVCRLVHRRGTVPWRLSDVFDHGVAHAVRRGRSGASVSARPTEYTFRYVSAVCGHRRGERLVRDAARGNGPVCIHTGGYQRRDRQSSYRLDAFVAFCPDLDRAACRNHCRRALRLVGDGGEDGHHAENTDACWVEGAGAL